MLFVSCFLTIRVLNVKQQYFHYVKTPQFLGNPSEMESDYLKQRDRNHMPKKTYESHVFVKEKDNRPNENLTAEMYDDRKYEIDLQQDRAFREESNHDQALQGDNSNKDMRQHNGKHSIYRKPNIKRRANTPNHISHNNNNANPYIERVRKAFDGLSETQRQMQQPKVRDDLIDDHLLWLPKQIVSCQSFALSEPKLISINHMLVQEVQFPKHPHMLYASSAMFRRKRSLDKHTKIINKVIVELYSVYDIEFDIFCNLIVKDGKTLSNVRGYLQKVITTKGVEEQSTNIQKYKLHCVWENHPHFVNTVSLSVAPCEALYCMLTVKHLTLI